MKQKDALKILTNQTKANVSFLRMTSPNGTISSNLALSRRKLRKLLFTHYYELLFNSPLIQSLTVFSGIGEMFIV